MDKECETAIQAGQAALIVTYGNTTRKHQPLDGDLVVLGRASTCDITLVSPEVAAVHCILQRGRDGWRLRDCCGGRHATRLNGRPVHEGTLHDCDVLQIGTFSFEVRLPSARTTPAPGSTPIADERLTARLKRLQRSRRNLLRLALRLRRRAHKNSSSPPTLAELERQAECLRGLQRDYQTLIAEYEERRNELEKAEREVCDERAAFDSECAERRAQLEIASQEMAARLDRRRQELDYFARHLRRRQSLQQMPPADQAVSREGRMRDRLAQLPSLKHDLAGSSPSAPGDQLREDLARLTADLVQ